jgi:DNA gyrase subunit A
MIPDNSWLTIFSRQGMVKRLPLNTFSIQSRGGKGNTLSKLKEDDRIGSVGCVDERSRLFLLTSTGRAFAVEHTQFPEMGKYAKGKPVTKFLPLSPGEAVTAHCPLTPDTTDGYITFVTARGVLKKTELSKFQKIRSTGTNAISLDEGDFAKDIFLSNGSQSFLIGTKAGKAIRFSESGLRATGKGARGVRAIRLQGGDEVIGGLAGDENTDVLTVSEKGFAKRTKLGLYRQSGRGGQGVANVRNIEKVGSIKAVLPVDSGDRVASTSEMGKVILVEAGGIREAGRGSSGVMLMRLAPSDRVAYVTKVG